MPSSVTASRDTFPNGEGLERLVQMVYIRTGFVCLPPFFLSFVTFSAPSVRGLSPNGDWGSFALCKNSFRHAPHDTSLTEGGKKLDAPRMRAIRQSPLRGLCDFCTFR